jgi:hypothetical protein
MNLNKYLLIGTLSVIATNALAEGQNIMTSKSYVDAQDALKQDNIPARATKIANGDATFAPSVVTNTTTAGTVGQMAILTYEYVDGLGLDLTDFDERDDTIPTTKLVAQEINDLWDNMPDISGLQTKIPAGTNGYLATHSGTAGTFGTPVNPATFQSAIATDLVDFDGADVRAIVATNATGTALTGDTVGIVSRNIMADSFDSVENWDDDGPGSINVNNFVPDISVVQEVVGFVNTKQDKMTCAGWPDSVPVADRTDANCWLWNKN